MPQLCRRDLPPTLQQLPQAARETYQRAYNKARLSYRAANGAQPDLEEIAHHVALASLEACYHRTARGRWVAD